jgi:hypothetical protein
MAKCNPVGIKLLAARTMVQVLGEVPYRVKIFLNPDIIPKPKARLVLGVTNLKTPQAKIIFIGLSQ